MSKVDVPFLQSLKLRLDATTGLAIGASLVPLLLVLGKPPEVKVVGAGAACAIVLGAKYTRKNTRMVTTRLADHLEVANSKAQRQLLVDYSPEPEKPETLTEMAVRMLKSGMKRDDIIQGAWGFKGELYPEGLEHWRRLGLPER